ncbi:MAG: hypothetical protein AAB698_01950 [Patescibacteria group bacterium]
MEITHEQKRNQIILCVIVVSLIILYGLYHCDFLNQTDIWEPKVENAIQLGHVFSYALFTDAPDEITSRYNLDEILTGDAKEKFRIFSEQKKLAHWRTQAMELFKDKKRPHRGLIAETILATRNDLKLVALMGDGADIMMSFGYIDPPIRFHGATTTMSFPKAKISGEDNMFFTIEVRYEIYGDKRIGARVLDKIFNFTPTRFVYTLLYSTFRLIGNCFDEYSSCSILRVLPDSLISPYSIMRGRWVIYDYDYNYNLNDYYTWFSQRNS